MQKYSRTFRKSKSGRSFESNLQNEPSGKQPGIPPGGSLWQMKSGNVLIFTLILLQYLHEPDNFSAKIARNRIKQNEFPKAFVGNCKPHTIFTATKNLLRAGKQFFHLRQFFLLVVHTIFSVVCILSRTTVSKQGEEVRRPVEKLVVLREFQSNKIIH